VTRAADSSNAFDPGQRLRRLIALRWVAMAAELALVLLTRQWLGAANPVEPVLVVCAAQLGLNLATLAYSGPRASVSDLQLFGQLLFDVGALTAIAFFAGGSANPLISLYLLWIAVGAAMLEARLAAALAAICIASYSFVNFVHAEVHIHDHERALEAHLIGMWVVFVFSAATITWSVVRLTAAVRRRDAALAQAREAALRNERVVALGNLAAGAAHELGTPLATMLVLAGELERDSALPSALRPDLALLQDQIRECKRIITQLAAQAGSSRAESVAPGRVDAWLERLLQRWRLQRPMVEPRLQLSGARPGPDVAIDATIEQALLSLFNNAADASPDRVEIEASWDERGLELRILDRGKGIPAELSGTLGREPVSSQGGMGVGVVLAFAAIERGGGRLALQPRDGGGTLARVTLPLAGPPATKKPD
jgi:two-component system sensor histidine kinase RegB